MSPSVLMDMHRTIAEFVAEVIQDESNEDYAGDFTYQISVHRADGSAKPFIYTSDSRTGAGSHNWALTRGG
jgi:hypothetical protein